VDHTSDLQNLAKCTTPATYWRDGQLRMARMQQLPSCNGGSSAHRHAHFMLCRTAPSPADPTPDTIRYTRRRDRHPL